MNAGDERLQHCGGSAVAIAGDRAQQWRTVATGSPRAGGFSLVELAIVLIVLGLLSHAMLVPLADVVDRSRTRDAAAVLERARAALVGHAIATGHLPCPTPDPDRASPLQPLGGASRGRSGSRLASSRAPTTPDAAGPYCSVSEGGLPPSLGVQGAGHALGGPVDPWGRPLRYAVSLYSSDTAGNPAAPDWTTPGELSAVGVDALDADLVLCRQAVDGVCGRGALQATDIVAVVWSAGNDNSGDGDQHENRDRDRVFASVPRSDNPQRPFDDQVVWLSRLELGFWLLRAGWLP